MVSSLYTSRCTCCLFQQAFLATCSSARFFSAFLSARPFSFAMYAERKENVSLLERLETTSLRLKRLENALNPVKASIVRSPRAHRRDLPVIVAITPTYTRPTQKADLTRLSLTLRQVPNFHWILVEDSKVKTDKVKRFLSK